MQPRLCLCEFQVCGDSKEILRGRMEHLTPRSLLCLLSECWIGASVHVFGYNSSKEFANKQAVDCFPEAEGEKVACLANGMMNSNVSLFWQNTLSDQKVHE